MLPGLLRHDTGLTRLDRSVTADKNLFGSDNLNLDTVWVLTVERIIATGVWVLLVAKNGRVAPFTNSCG
jgi:hypothetical protein